MNHQNKWLMTSWNTLIVLCATSCSIGLPRVSCQFCSVHPECNPLLSDHYTDLQSHQSCCWLLPIPRELASQGQQRQQGMTQSCSHRPKPIVQRGSNLYELNLSIIMCSSNLRFFLWVSIDIPMPQEGTACMHFPRPQLLHTLPETTWRCSSSCQWSSSHHWVATLQYHLHTRLSMASF